MNCKACGKTSAKHTSVSFFRFPKESSKCRDWAERCDLLDLYEKHGTSRFYKSFRICSDHFDSKDMLFDGRKKRLVQSAVPLLGRLSNGYKQKVNEKNQKREELLKLKLCRLCATENKNLTDIYEGKGKVLDLESKLKYFPVMINKSDSLPLRMCHQCISKVNQFHDFVLSCIRAETKLKVMLNLPTNNQSSPAVQGTSVWSTDKTPNLNSQAVIDDLSSNFSSGGENDFRRVLHDNFLNKDSGCICQFQQPSYTKTNHTSTSVNFEHDYSNMVTRDQLLLDSELQLENDQNFLEESRHPCDICLESFCSIEVLNAHSLTHSIQSELRDLTCKICNKLFFSRFEFDEHSAEHADKDDTCKICDKKLHKVAFLEKNSMENSCDCFSDLRPSKINPESGAKPSESLPKSNENSSSLQHDTSSGKTNSKIQKRQCQFCHKTFKSRQLCQTHEKFHKEYAPYKCKQCGKAFRSRPSLRQHKSVHSDERLYNCQECGMSFKRKDTLGNHLRIHTGERPFVCKVCGFAFKQRGDCTKHERNHKRLQMLQDELQPQTETGNTPGLDSSTKDLIGEGELNDGTLWDDEKNSPLLSQAGPLDDIVPGRMIPLNL